MQTIRGTLIGALTLAALLVALLALATPAEAQGPTCNGLAATIVGTENDDVIRGTDAADVIVALGGNDVIYGYNGADTICGGDGIDRILGGKRSDWIDGGADRDKLFGDVGSDTIFGGTGNDLLVGGQGDDILYGGNGKRDRLYGRADTAQCFDDQAATRYDAVCRPPLVFTDGTVGAAVSLCQDFERFYSISGTLAAGFATNRTTETRVVRVTVSLLDAAGRIIETEDARVIVGPGGVEPWTVDGWDLGEPGQVVSCIATATSGTFDVVDEVMPVVSNVQCDQSVGYRSPWEGGESLNDDEINFSADVTLPVGGSFSGVMVLLDIEGRPVVSGGFVWISDALQPTVRIADSFDVTPGFRWSSCEFAFFSRY